MSMNKTCAISSSICLLVSDMSGSRRRGAAPEKIISIHLPIVESIAARLRYSRFSEARNNDRDQAVGPVPFERAGRAVINQDAGFSFLLRIFDALKHSSSTFSAARLEPIPNYAR